ncbi:MAG TPA: peptidylprolyl isomerase [Azospirillum sp.]|nr:peptidylprolyl isomerase [Azospirillum sp.]
MKLDLLLAAWLASSALLLPFVVQAQEIERPGAAVVAKINDQPITWTDLETALARASRQTFYHGSVSPERVAELRRKVLDDMIVEQLLLSEAKRRGIAPDDAMVEERIAKYEAQYKDSQQWPALREQVLPELRARMRENSQRSRLEAEVRNVSPPTDAQLEAFYKENLPLFTEPARSRVSMILLTVDPGAPQATWDAAKQEAERIRDRILKGASFADLAKMHSNDQSSAQGGDMGYLHRGMLARDAQDPVDQLEVGQLSEPILLLQGYGLFQLTDRLAERRRSLEDVRERAVELYRRNTGEKRWADTTVSLRRKARIWIDDALRQKPSAASN